MSADDKRNYKNYQTERVKQYKSEDWKDIKGTVKDFKSLTEEQQEDYFKKIGVDKEEDQTKDQKKIAAYIRAEAEQMGGSKEEIEDRYKSALEYYNNSYDLKISPMMILLARLRTVLQIVILLFKYRRNKALDEWGGNWDEASEEARKIYTS